MKNKLLVFILSWFIFFNSIGSASASDLTISDLTWYYEGSGANRTSWCLFTLQWENAWNTSKNHDAAWIFLKLVRPGTQARHAFIANNGVKLVTDHTNKNIRYDIKISDDQAGFFINPAEKYRGKV
jgi:hypothetical protein